MDNFYEDDEPVEEIKAMFDAGEKGITKEPDEDDEFETDEAAFDAMMREGEPAVLVEVPETALDRWRKLRKFVPREFDPEAAKDLLNEVREFSELRRRATTIILGED